MKLSEMRQLLDQRSIQLTKSLGQNFLHDGNQLRRISESAALAPADKVLEIGPGLGPLTELLLNTGAHVLAIEKDARLVSVLADRFRTHVSERRLELLHADALDVLKERRDWLGWKLVANLPYSVASPILVELALSAGPPDRIVATLQAEVVERLIASPNTEAYGLLTVLAGVNYSPAGSFRIPSSCFFPSPDVESACVTLLKRPQPLVFPHQLDNFTKLVKLAFSQRRKMMLKLLKSRFPETSLRAAFQSIGLSPTVRAEKVSIEDFARLTQNIYSL